MILLDTHAWMWWVDSPALLSDSASREIDSADSVAISVISCWEVGMLVSRRKLRLDRDVKSWVQRALLRPGIVSIPLDPRAAIEAAELDPRSFSADPADRMIYATARANGATLVTKDRRIRDFDPRGTLW